MIVFVRLGKANIEGNEKIGVYSVLFNLQKKYNKGLLQFSSEGAIPANHVWESE